MEFGLGILAGLVIGSFGSLWIAQRALNRISFFPTWGRKKAKVFTPTELDRERAKKDQVKRIKKQKQQESEVWAEKVKATAFQKIRSK